MFKNFLDFFRRDPNANPNEPQYVPGSNIQKSERHLRLNFGGPGLAQVYQVKNPNTPLVTFGNLPEGSPYTSLTPTLSSVPQPFYQVTDDDQSLQDVSAKTGVPLPQLVDANNGVKSLPPKGSFIQTQPEAAPVGFVAGPGGVDLTETSMKIQQQVAAGQMPPTVSFYTPIINPATGQPVTDAEMMKNGYTYDNQQKQWSLTGAPQQTGNNGPKTGNNWQTNAALRQVSYKGKFMTSAKWAANALRRQRRNDG